MKSSRTYLSAVAIVAVAAFGAAGCGSGKKSGGGGSGSSGSGGDTSKTLVVGTNVAPTSLDPTSGPSAAIDEIFDYNVYQHLVQLTPSGKLVPTLASSYSLSKDGRIYTFHLRRGVSFSNGDRLTAADVVFSLKRAVSPKSPYPYAGLLADMQSATAPDPHTVTVTLKKRSWDFLYDLAAYSNGVVLDPKAVSTIATKPVGTGPFAFKSEVSNYSVALTANDHYWGDKPQVAGVTFRNFQTAQAENSALQTGQINVIDQAINAQDIGPFQGNSQFAIIHGPTNGKVQVTMNNAVGPLKKLGVRRAIEYAIDRRAIIKNEGNYGTQISSGTVPGDPWYVDLDSTYPYNPAKAKQLLAQAGYPHGFSLTMTLPPYGYAGQDGTIVAQELKAVGITVTTKNVQLALWLKQVFGEKSFDLTIVNHIETRDLGNYGNPAYYWNYAGAARAGAVLAAGDAAPTRAQWIARYKQVVRTIADDAVNGWLYTPSQLTIAQQGLTGLPASGRLESFDVTHATFGGSVPASVTALGYTG